ncbi:MAG: DegV family protein [Acidimicrobiales bacterium]
MMIGLVIDSSSQIPADLVEEFEVEVVPITVTIDDDSFREGVDIDADAFYEMVAEPLPEIGTSQPSPGEFLQAFEALTARGAEEILCVTMADKHSGTFNSARIAGDISPVPVRLVNSQTMSFGVTACFWEAAAAISDGTDLETAALRAEALAPNICSTFLLQSLDQMRKMGRVDFDALAPDIDEVGVYVTRGVAVDVAGAGSTIEELSELMLAQVPTDIAIRTGVCLAAPEMLPYSEILEKELATRDNMLGTVRYRVGPSVAAHTGPGTAGLFWWPVVDSV